MKTFCTFFLIGFVATASLAAPVVLSSSSNQQEVAAEENALYASEEGNAVYNLTTNGTGIGAMLDIYTYPKGSSDKTGDIEITLDKFSIEHATPIVIHGSGTVTFNVVDLSRIESTAVADAIIINAPDANLRFTVESGTNLRITTPFSGGGSVNVLPIYAKSVTHMSGILYCYARSKVDSAYGDDYPLTPCIVTETFTLSGTFCPSFLATKEVNISAVAKQVSPVKYTTFICTTGTVAINGNKFPEATNKVPDPTITANKRYDYPKVSYAKLQGDAQGGTIFGKKIFSFPDWTDFTGNKADYLSCFKSSTTGENPKEEAITIDAENKTITIDTSKCPKPELVYAKDGTAGAIDLFGASAGPTAEGIAVTYNFGIDWIGVADGAIQMTVAVDLPNETADSKEFHITVTDEDSSVVFKGNLTFTRIEGNRFRSTPIDDARKNPYDTGFTFHKYRVFASEP